MLPLRSAALLLLVTLLTRSLAADPKVSFNEQVRPILSQNCFACHGPDSASRKAKLRLDVRAEALAKKAFVPGKPAESELLKRLVSKDPEEVMPPPDSHRLVTPAQRELLSRWIADPAVQVVISSGGTGLTGRDGTPEAVAPLLDKSIEGFGELFRVLSFESIGTSTLQSRCLAGVANGTVIFVLPGSLDAVETAWDRLIRAQLDTSTKPCNLVQLLPRLREQVQQPAP